MSATPDIKDTLPAGAQGYKVIKTLNNGTVVVMAPAPPKGRKIPQAVDPVTGILRPLTQEEKGEVGWLAAAAATGGIAYVVACCLCCPCMTVLTLGSGAGYIAHQEMQKRQAQQAGAVPTTTAPTQPTMVESNNAI